jgi:hypothetical protein
MVLKIQIETPILPSMIATNFDNASSCYGRRARRWIGSSIAALLVVAGVLVLTATPAFAGTLTKVSWTVNNSQTGKTGVTYAYAFTTATAGTLIDVTMTVPTGTAGTAAVGTVYGLGAGTASLSGTTLTYTITSPISVAANIPIYVSFTGLTNTSTAGSYTSTITTQKSGPSTVDSAASGSVTFGSSSTGVTVTVGQTLTFTNNTPSFSLAVDPSMLNNIQNQAVVLTVQTNAASGYTLAASDTGLSRTAPAYTIPAVSSGPGTGVASFPTSGWGASATVSGGGTDGATLATGLAGSKWVGYPSTAANLLTATGPTGTTADTLTLTDQVAVDYTVPDGTYADTITYVVTPTF